MFIRILCESTLKLCKTLGIKNQVFNWIFGKNFLSSPKNRAAGYVGVPKWKPRMSQHHTLTPRKNIPAQRKKVLTPKKNVPTQRRQFWLQGRMFQPKGRMFWPKDEGSNPGKNVPEHSSLGGNISSFGQNMHPLGWNILPWSLNILLWAGTFFFSRDSDLTTPNVCP